MSKVLRTVAIVAAVVAIAATGLGAILGPAAFAATFGASATTIAGIASPVAVAAFVGSLALARPPEKGKFR